MNYRSEIINKLIPYFRQDERYYLLIGDMGFGAIDRIRDEFPDKVYNCGVMEQGSVGIAAGMAITGLIPIFYTIVNFLAFRAIEQVRNDVVLQGLNVKFIGTGANDYFDFLGPSHTCGEQDVQIMKMVGVDVYDPYTQKAEKITKILSKCSFAPKPQETYLHCLVHEWITKEWATYIRV